MARQSNLAYDFERFEVQAQKPKEKVKIKVVSQRQQKRQNRYFVAKVAACVTVFFCGSVGNHLKPGGNYRGDNADYQVQPAFGTAAIRLPYLDCGAGKLDGAE